MAWKRETVDTTAEKNLITGMIINDRFLRAIQPILHRKLLQTEFARTISGWCLDYFRTYEKAPGGTIQEIYNSYAGGDRVDESKAELIGNFLSNLSEDYESNAVFNCDYHLDQAEKYLRERALQKLREDINLNLISGNVGEAEKCIIDFKKPVRQETKGIDILRDKQALNDAFNDEVNELFSMPGELGRFLKPFARSDLISVAGKMKGGKSWWLEDIGIRGLMNRFNVLFISLEMTAPQMMMRLFQTFMGEPKKAKTVTVPYFEGGYIEAKEVQKKGLRIKDAAKKAELLAKMTKPNQFKLWCPAVANVYDLQNYLDTLEHNDGFIPDIIIVDYADILQPEPDSPKDYRHRLDATWKALRELAKQKRCLVVTATQTTRATLSRDIEQGDMAEDIRKLAHVSCMIALNQDEKDKERGLMRIKILVARHEHFDMSEMIVLQSLAIGRPYLDSMHSKKIKNL